jgi:FtsP/CotA-like multicopper oxidase with cupredoxin domain
MKHSLALISLASAFPGTLAAPAPVHDRARGAMAPASQDTLTSPPVLVNTSTVPHTVEVTLTAEVKRLSLRPGTTTEVFTYNGTVPGPTLEMREGDHVIVHFHNKLPEQTTIHWHGLHVPITSDGSPFYPIQPGGQKDYVFTVPRGSAGTYWYHPHPHFRAGYQVAKGLFGAIIVRAADDPLPASLPDKLIILSDNRFRPDGSVDIADPHSMKGGVDLENGREGNVIFVNGQVMPKLTIRSGEVQRWRVVNASAARVFRLAIPGQTLLHVGSDGGLFEKPEEVKDVIIANSERAELLVRGTGAPGTMTVLQTLPYDRYAPQTRPEAWAPALGIPVWKDPLDVLSLQYSTASPVTAPAIPATLRRIEALDTAKSKTTRLLVFSQGLINGRIMDMNRVDVSARLGDTEIWQLENVVGMDHPFHLHGFQFQVLDRNGVPEKQRRWKDTVNVPKHESVRIIVRYDDNPGRWMFHCHILDHEDHGMMGILEVK